MDRTNLVLDEKAIQTERRLTPWLFNGARCHQIYFLPDQSRSNGDSGETSSFREATG